MKLLFSLSLILIITACNQDSTNSKINKPSYLDLKISDNQEIFGSWTMCASLGNGTLNQTNVCPRIIFKSNGTGNVEKSESRDNPFLSSESFVWNLEKNHLTILSQSKNSTFSDTNYYVKFNKHEIEIDMTISHDDVSYYLKREY